MKNIAAAIAIVALFASCEGLSSQMADGVETVDTPISIGSAKIYDLESLDSSTRSSGRTDDQIRYVDSFVEGDIMCIETIEADTWSACYFYYEYSGGEWVQHASSEGLTSSIVNASRSVKAHLLPGAEGIDSKFSWSAGDDLWTDPETIYPDILQDFAVDLVGDELEITLTRCYNCKLYVSLQSDNTAIDLEDAVVDMNSSIAITKYKPTDSGMNVTRQVIDFRPMRQVGESYEIMLVDLTSSSNILFTITTKSGDVYVSSVNGLTIEPNKYSTVEITLKVS
ncbi:MAG: hypothetical protein SNH94_05340 [Rikenellaceae bacterium]